MHVMSDDENGPWVMTVVTVPLATVMWGDFLDTATKIVALAISLCVLVWWILKLNDRFRKRRK